MGRRPLCPGVAAAGRGKGVLRRVLGPNGEWGQGWGPQALQEKSTGQ